MIHLKLEIPVSPLELRANIYDFFRNEGYFPLTLCNGRVFKFIRQPIWDNHWHNKPVAIFHDPQLVEWPAVTLVCDVRDQMLKFKVDHWKSQSWCESQTIYAGRVERNKLAPSMISDDPMRHANLGC
jgi:hypothetical protein